MSFQTSSVLALTFLLLGTATCQVFDVYGSTDAGNPEFNLEIDEVFLTDLENAPVSTHHMRPGNFGVKLRLITFLRDNIMII